VADSFHFDIDMIRPVAHGSPQLRPHPVQGHRFQALDLPAGLALKVGVGRVVLAGQFKVVDPALQGELPHHAPVSKILQDAVHRDFVHPAAGPDQFQNLLGPQSPEGLAQNFQDRQPHRGGPQAFQGQPMEKIAAITHKNLLLENQLSCKFIVGGGCLEKFKVQGSKFKIKSGGGMNFSCFTAGPKAHEGLLEEWGA